MPVHSFPTALRIFLAAALVSASASSAEPEPTPEARAHFQAGVGHLDNARYADAYREFSAAYAAAPRWKILGNLGVAAMHLERDGEAIEALEQYLERGASDIGAREATRARARLQELRTRSAAAILDAPGPFWVVDTRLDSVEPVVNEYGPFDGSAELRVHAGDHEFHLDRARHRAPAWKAELRAGDVARHAFVVEPEPSPGGDELVAARGAARPAEPDAARTSHTRSYVLWGAGAAGTVATTVVALEAHRLQTEADEDFARSCPSGASGEPGCERVTAGAAKAANWRTGALVTGIGTFGLLLSGTILYFIDEPSDADASQEATLTPWITPTGVGVSGTF